MIRIIENFVWIDIISISTILCQNEAALEFFSRFLRFSFVYARMIEVIYFLFEVSLSQM